MKRTIFIWLLPALALLQFGCAHLDSSGTVEFAPDAEGNYRLGLKSMEERRHLDAMQFFEHVRYRHPYSAVAALADLAIADNFFVQDKFAEAAESYKNFVKLHPNHPKVDYAEYRIALSHYKDIPMDLFFIPPSCEKDQGAVRGAASNFSEFLKKYPDSSYAAEAREKLKEVIERLVDHEMSVAKFYRRHDHYKSAAARYEVVMRDFPESVRAGEALVGLAESRCDAEQFEAARAAVERLRSEFSAAPEAAKAESLLKDIASSEAKYQARKAKEEKKAAEKAAKEAEKAARDAEKAAKKAAEEEEAAKKKREEQQQQADAADSEANAVSASASESGLGEN